MAGDGGIQRTIGLAGATSIGIGAIVGGGILALAGVAFSATGPSALVAFGLNGVIALLTALSFAEMSAAFPESGGTYIFAKKILSVRVAFGVGWVVWFASLVAAVLYALGFAAFVVLALREAWVLGHGSIPALLESRWTVSALAVAATLGFTLIMLRRGGGSARWINLAKIAVFSLVIAGGIWAVARSSGAEMGAHLVPFFPGGTAGLFQAMGFTFIALQGFDLIAAVAGEIKDPGRTIPRAMVGSLGVALAIYLPLLFVIAAAGAAPGESLTELARSNPEGVVAVAARRFLGEFGYWLVLAAGVLFMLSALQANLFAASRVAFAMARDRTITPRLGHLDPGSGIPPRAVLAVGGIVSLILLVVPDVATAGAASSLIFLVSFALAHYLNILLRRRLAPSSLPFRVPGFPLVPLIGGTACMGLAFYQSVSVPAAGVITVMWLTLGAGLYAFRYAGRAQVFDASAEGIDPLLVKHRGRNPMVLLPVADPANAGALVAVAQALSPPGVGRVLLLSVVHPPVAWQEGQEPASLLEMSAVQREAMTTSFARGLAPESLMTVAAGHWGEIARVARLHRCEAILLGLRSIREESADPDFNEFLSTAPCDVVMLRAPRDWHLRATRRVLIPVGGKGSHSLLRARLLGSLRRSVELSVTYLCLPPPRTPQGDLNRMRGLVRSRAEDEMGGRAEVVFSPSPDPATEIIRRAREHDLLILGLHHGQAGRRAIGAFTLRLARETDCALLVLGRKTR